MEEQASLLTANHRKVLTGNKPAAHSGKTVRRIRNRVYAGLRNDGPILLEQLDAGDRRKIFRAWEKGVRDDELTAFPGEFAVAEELRQDTSSSDVERAYFKKGLTDLLAFLYLGIEEGGIGDFKEILSTALSTAAENRGQKLDKYTFEAEMSDRQLQSLSPEEIARRVKEGDGDVTLHEVRRAVEAGALEQDEVEKII